MIFDQKMDISMPAVIVGYKDNDLETNKIKKNIAIDILSSILIRKSSEFFEELYEKGKILSEPSMIYEFSKTYAHVLIQAQTNFVEEFTNKLDEKIKKEQKFGINSEDFERAKRKAYGEFVKEYNDVSTIATNLVSDYFKKINSFEYFEEFETITKEYVEEVVREIFVDDMKVISVIKPLED